MKRIAWFIVHKPKVIFALTAIITIAALFSFTRAKLDVSFTSMMEIGEDSIEDFHTITEKYGGTEALQVVVRSDSGITNVEMLSAI